jgi:hypothetical protein
MEERLPDEWAAPHEAGQPKLQEILDTLLPG